MCQSGLGSPQKAQDEQESAEGRLDCRAQPAATQLTSDKVKQMDRWMEVVYMFCK